MKQNLEPKLMVITRQDLTIGYQAVQSCHATADFAEQHPEEFSSWKKQSNSIICLAALDESHLYRIKTYLESKGIASSCFYEPDIDNALTSVCFFATPELRKKYSYLPLVGKVQKQIPSLIGETA